MKVICKEGYEFNEQDVKVSYNTVYFEPSYNFGYDGDYNVGTCLGWMVGDGSINADQVVLGFDKQSNCKDTELVDYYMRQLNRIHTQYESIYNTRDHEYSYYPIQEERTVLIRSTLLRYIANDYGYTCKADKLHIPYGNINKEMYRGFLKGLYSADGSVYYNKTKGIFNVSLVSISRQLLREVQDLLLGFNIYSILYNGLPERETTFPNGRTSLCKQSYILYIHGIDCFKFYNEIGFLLSLQQAKLLHGMNSYEKKPKRRNYVAKLKEVTNDQI